jgi:hypothetical protein
LDPFEQHDDAILNDALRAAGLFSLQVELKEARLTLDSNIASGGGNLSVGQRQILALARAIVRGSKLLILDEGELCSLLRPAHLFTLVLLFKQPPPSVCFDDHFPFGPLLIYYFRLQDGFHHSSYFAAPNEFRRYYHHCCSSIANNHGC